MAGRNRRVALAVGAMGVLSILGMTEMNHIGSGILSRARAEESTTQTATLEEYCHSWARNGMMGANVNRRGGTREITYIDENQLRYLIKHQVASDALYLLKGAYSPGEKRYLEDSLLAGYDRMDKWITEHGKDNAPDVTAWESDTFDLCMKDVPESIRMLLTPQ